MPCRSILDETTELMRAERGVLICRTRHGFVCANAGVDTSNAPDGDTLVVLPRDPDASARALRARLQELLGVRLACPDQRQLRARLAPRTARRGARAGRAWRRSTTGAGARTPAGSCSPPPGSPSPTRPPPRPTSPARRTRVEPVVLLEGLERFVSEDDGPGALALLRTREEDLFL